MHPEKTLDPKAVVAALPDQEICREALLEKYAKGKEQTITDVRERVARALAAAEVPEKRAHWERRFHETMEAGFIPAGRINSAAGIAMQATLINCFVQPVGDSISEVVDGKPGIYTALQEAAETMRRGGGVGYDFSSIRPKGADVKGTRSKTSSGRRTKPRIPTPQQSGRTRPAVAARWSAPSSCWCPWRGA